MFLLVSFPVSLLMLQLVPAASVCFLVMLLWYVYIAHTVHQFTFVLFVLSYSVIHGGCTALSVDDITVTFIILRWPMKVLFLSVLHGSAIVLVNLQVSVFLSLAIQVAVGILVGQVPIFLADFRMVGFYIFCCQDKWQIAQPPTTCFLYSHKSLIASSKIQTSLGQMTALVGWSPMFVGSFPMLVAWCPHGIVSVLAA